MSEIKKIIINGREYVLSDGGAVAFDEAQALNENQKNQARQNIGAMSADTKVSQLENDSGYLTGYTESDPTVPEWAKQPKKPTYTAEEVGALPANTEIPVVPTKVSAFENDKGYLTQHQDLSGYAKTTDIPTEAEIEEIIRNSQAVSEVVRQHLPDYAYSKGETEDLIDEKLEGFEVTDSTIHIGADEPTDNSNLWVDTDEESSGVTDEYINSLIDAKLGVIENGSY